MSGEASSGRQPTTVNVADLDIAQLADVKRQLDQELEHLTSSFAQLKQAQAKFSACAENVTQIAPPNANNTILVPLTTSLYVPGNLSDPEHVIVDVGTGYFVQKTRAEAVAHYKAKVEFVKKNIGSLQEALQTKQDNLNYLVNVMQVKMAQRQPA